jgi:nitrite reductase/ring-hydroxylating ferredoxin subunit
MSTKSAKRRFHQRLFCIPATPEPTSAAAWSYDRGVLRVDLSAMPELSAPDSAVRCESELLPDRVLLVHGIDDSFHAYSNHCGCGGFRIDPVPGEEKIRCCTLMQSTFDYAGNILSGSAKNSLVVYPLERDGDMLTVTVSTE